MILVFTARCLLLSLSLLVLRLTHGDIIFPHGGTINDFCIDTNSAASFTSYHAAYRPVLGVRMMATRKKLLLRLSILPMHRQWLQRRGGGCITGIHPSWPRQEPDHRWRRFHCHVRRPAARHFRHGCSKGALFLLTPYAVFYQTGGSLMV